MCLSIAGSDSGGGAGIQADLKAFAACATHGTTAITAITAQNTVGVIGVEAISPAMILAQVRAVVQDIGVDAVKIGMLGSVETTVAVSEALGLIDEIADGTRTVPVVVDPVMVAESGARLLEPEAQSALIELILPRATVVTPNLPEARALAAVDPDDEHDAAWLAREIRALGPAAVVVTGGHREGETATDVLLHGDEVIEIPGPRHPDGAAHGSGCTHSSALAAHLAHGFTVPDAARAARAIAGEAVRNGLREIGAGAGPVDVLDVSARSVVRGRGAAPLP